METFEDWLEKNFLEVKNARINYAFAPIPCELDQKICDLIKLFIQSAGAERLVFIDKAKPIAGYFSAFAIRSAALAVRERSRQRVVEGLLALIIENCRTGDYRDTITALAPLYNAAGKIELDSDNLLKEVASFVENDSTKLFKEFADRPAYSKRLQNFGYQEVNDSNGFRYVFVP